MKINKIIIFLFFISFGIKAQVFDRVWGTYLGPAGTNLASSLGYWDNSFDADENLCLLGLVSTENNYNIAYYNQFVTSGPSYDTSQNSNFFMTKISPTGSIIGSNYDSPLVYSYPNMSYDTLGNRYEFLFNNAGNTGNATSGTWMPSTIANENKYMLLKYSTNSIMQWKTYLPHSEGIVNITHDSTGNTYISGDTKQQSNFTTPNVFRENFEILYNGNQLSPNNYIVKLDPNGVLIWATYFPTAINKLQYYNGALYVLGSSDDNQNASVLATTGAFETQKAQASITKLDANTGNRLWGTYYGLSYSQGSQFTSDLKVNASGIYVLGDVSSYTNATNSYFGTIESHQPVESGNYDLYLSKFNHSGNRLWSTYFGSPGGEMSSFASSPMALVGDNVVITLLQYQNVGTANLATPGAFVSTMPTTTYFNGGTNMMFAEFTEDGVLSWASYYGGANNNDNQVNNPSINVASPNANTFYLFGNVSADTGFTTPGAAQTAKLPNMRTGFVARFDKKSQMGTTETEQDNSLVLYDNPNNGNFSLVGNALAQKNLQLKLYDASGRLVITRKLNNEKKQSFEFQNLLSKGNYIIEVSRNKTTLKTFKMIVK